MRLVTLLSDFGSTSPYPAEMKAALAAQCEALIIDITHDVPPHDVRTGAYLLRAVARHTPAGTVHVAVVDPGVGTGRRALILVAGGQSFVGPDNGLLLPAARGVGTPRAFAITTPRLIRDLPSATFHGRDLFAPAAGLLASGTPVEAIGAPAPNVIDLELGQGRRAERALRGHVLYVDAFGNVITDIPSDLLPPEGRQLDVQVGARRARGTVRSTYGDAARGALVVVAGSDACIEIAVREGRAARRLGVRAGSAVRLRER